MTQDASLDIIIGIPGLWPTRSDLIKAVATQTDRLLLAGPLLSDQKTQKYFQVDIVDHDPNLCEAFQVASMGTLSEEELAAIARHTSTLYLIGPGGTPELAQEMMEVAARLLHAGGLGVKVETSGVGHSKEKWQEFASHGISALSTAYTAYLKSQGNYLSCGMHNLGLRDVSVTADIGMQEALYLLKTFLFYTATERPILESGHTFSVDAQAPRYRLMHQEQMLYPPDDPFHNPFGVWHLLPIE